MTSLAQQWNTQLAEHLGRDSRAPQWLSSLRRAGSEAFGKYGLPHRKVEDWKYTSLKMLEARSHALVAGSRAATKHADVQWPEPLAGEGAVLVRMLNGRPVDGLEGAGPAELQSLESALEDAAGDSWLAQALGNLEIDTPARAFSALNASMLEHGLVIDVPADRDGGTLMLQWAFDATAPAMLFNARVVIRLQPGARLTVVEQFESPDDHAHGLNLVTQVDIGEGATLNHVRVQQEADDAALILRTEADIHENGRFETTAFDWGGGLVRQDTRPRLLSPKSSADVNGAFVLSGERHLDHHVYADHVSGQTTSGQFFRGVLGGKSRGVFNGKARIQKGADGSSVRQSNANLLLSRRAEMDTKPELEIYADEVEAAHGATVGQLDEDAVFYLRSRGLSDEQARGMLTSAFCKAVLDQTTHLPASLGQEIARRMEIALSDLTTTEDRRHGPGAFLQNPP